MSEPNYESDANSILHPAFSHHLLHGAVIGVISRGQPQVFTVGQRVPLDGLIETGSVSKVFTGLALAKLVDQGRITLDASILDFLPAWLSASPLARPIRIIDLATHTSGLPLLPDDVGRMKRRIDDPYAGYTRDDIYRYLARTSLERPATPTYCYSNLGYVVLANCLENATGIPFADLVRQEVLLPLGMRDSFIDVPADRPVLPGHAQLGRPAIRWDAPVFAGCGGVCSTAQDMLRFLQLFLDPPAEWQPIVSNMTKVRVQTGDEVGTQMALAWKLEKSSGWYWHSGVTGGHTAYLSFRPRDGLAMVVLTDRYAVDLITDFGKRMQRVLEGEAPQPMTGYYGLPVAIASQAVIEFVHLPFWIRAGVTATIAGSILAEVLPKLPK